MSLKSSEPSKTPESVSKKQINREDLQCCDAVVVYQDGRHIIVYGTYDRPDTALDTYEEAKVWKTIEMKGPSDSARWFPTLGYWMD